MTQSSEAKFSFKNLEPINYLKTFNKMIDYQARNSSQQAKKAELKVVSLSKFPTPRDYQNMQGIFENVNKKKIQNDMNKYNKELEQEQKFIKKHNQFMRRVLQKFIQHNESRQKNYQKQKIFYSKDFKTGNHLRSLSEAKLKFKKDVKDNEKALDNENTQGKKATLGSQIFTDTKSEQKSIQILPKLQPRKKKEKINLKKEKEIQQYIINRKLTNPQVASSARSPIATPYQQQEDNIDFKAEIIQLQKKQAKIQNNFTERIQKEIDQFKRKMSIQVHAINYYNFWNEPKGNQSQQGQRQKGKENSKDQERVELLNQIPQLPIKMIHSHF